MLLINLRRLPFSFFLTFVLTAGLSCWPSRIGNNLKTPVLGLFRSPSRIENNLPTNTHAVNLLRYASMVQIHSLPPVKKTSEGRLFCWSNVGVCDITKAPQQNRTKSRFVKSLQKGRDLLPCRALGSSASAFARSTWSEWLQIHSLPPVKKTSDGGVQ